MINNANLLKLKAAITQNETIIPSLHHERKMLQRSWFAQTWVHTGCLAV